MVSPTVLLVEDDYDVRDSLTRLLKAYGFQVIDAANGQIAIDLLQAAGTLPDLILLDLMMPVMDGWGFRVQQQQIPALAAIPVIVFTAHALTSEMLSTLKVESYLRKPVHPRMLMDKITESMAS